MTSRVASDASSERGGTVRSVAFLVRRPDLERAAFRAHYERVHAPLARPSLGALDHYVRNHVVREQADGPIGFDVISEFEYTDREAFETMQATVAGPAGDAIRADELRFMDKPANSYFASARCAASATPRPEPGALAKAIGLLDGRGAGSDRSELARRAAGVGRSWLASDAALAAELDVALAGDPFGPPRWETLLHLWLAPRTDTGSAIAALARDLTLAAPGAATAALWVEECGERSLAEPPGEDRP